MIKTLIVEDQEITRLGLRLVLQQFSDVEIVGEAADGELAVALVQELAPNVVLMDIGLPGIDGIEATTRIKAMELDTKVLMLTSHDHVDDVFAALSAGAHGYCLKTATPDRIVQTMRVIVSGAVSLDPEVVRTFIGHVKFDGSNASAPLVGKKVATRDSKFGLSARELEVLNLVMDGLSNQEMATKLYITSETVKTHMRHIMEKLMVSDRTQAAVKALREGLFPDKASHAR